MFLKREPGNFPARLLGMGAAFLTLFALSLHVLPARADTSYIVLQSPAIPVNNPAHVLLIAVTRAGDRLVAVGGHGIIIYSDDNGVSWKQAAVPVEVSLTSIAFATPKIGWAAGAYGVVLHTTDGGVTWQTQITGIEVLQLMQQNAGKFAAANPTDPGAARAVRRAGIFLTDGPDKPFLTILANSSTHAIVYGAYRMCIETQDGGKNWADCSLTVLDPVSHNLYSILQAKDGIYMVGEAGDVFSYNAATNQYDALNSPGDNTLFDVLETKSGALLAYGVADGMFRSTDQGKDWTEIAVPGSADLTGGTVMDNGGIVIVSTNGNTALSTDDGQSFHDVPLILGMGLFDVTTAANGDVVFVGSGGVRVVKQSALDAAS